ncbi:hypothetical protein L226DRAFT_568817 [Lentinus tigrinus ALCF2SS1-7]|uniref:Uncharacterized protein n=1 Tax=Lentinus tigrinus ALCF2SS1-6 TaxID=1328759 RepID=A0A5C2SF93_9APHY|nr:hypothetical protein L227DRAFT_35150 [Lentinus tigrinus ALCF2SS1-6]RPD77823.1 hypothetical protein L226DRAFT_568817 [Lentinus tigrinus ALCF2SS1-7]
MGGNAFKNLLPDASFPRMSPALYGALKARLIPILQELYTHVAVSPECPGKIDHGDLDFVVSEPREGLTLGEVKSALRATCSVPMEGNRTSNYAIPLDAFEDVALMYASTGDGDEATELTTGDGKFFQVDVNVCEDRAQWERTVFYTSYGDLGFFLGLLAQTAGLSFNIFGLKLAEPIETSPPRTYYLSTSMRDIVAFFGLSMHRWEQGFASQEDIFRWITTSPFALPLLTRYRSADYKSSAKERADTRPMRIDFIRFLRNTTFQPLVTDTSSPFSSSGDYDKKLDAALKHFGKDREHAALRYVGQAQRRAREILNGKTVQQWTGVQGMPVRFIMDEVKDRLSDTSPCPDEVPGAKDVPAWQVALLRMSDAEVRTLVVEVKEEMAQDGRLSFDWRAAKAAKEEKKRQKDSVEGGLTETHEHVVAVAAS